MNISEGFNSKVRFRLFIGSIFLSGLLVLVSCAPVTEQVSQMSSSIGRSVGGVQVINYNNATAWDVVLTLSKEAFSIQPSNVHSFMNADNLTDSSLVLVSTPVSGSAVLSNIDSNDAKDIMIKVIAVDKAGHVEVTLTPEPASYEVARDTVMKVMQKLDESLNRL